MRSGRTLKPHRSPTIPAVRTFLEQRAERNDPGGLGGGDQRTRSYRRYTTPESRARCSAILRLSLLPVGKKGLPPPKTTGVTKSRNSSIRSTSDAAKPG